jgi:hypothetical protein
MRSRAVILPLKVSSARCVFENQRVWLVTLAQSRQGCLACQGYEVIGVDPVGMTTDPIDRGW